MKQPIALLLRVVAALALGYQSYVHFHLASTYDPVAGSLASQGDLFRVEGVAAGLAALAVLVFRTWWSAALAASVAGGGVAAVLLYRYVDVGAFAGLPNMYEPVWYAEKTRSAIAEGVGAVTAVSALALSSLPGRMRIRTAQA